MIGALRASLVALLAGTILATGTERSRADDDAWTCRVVSVIDGDTIDVQCPDGRERVRLLRIDTPERGEPGYAAAAKALRRLVGKEAVVLEFEKRGLAVADDYGRLLAYVHAGGRNVNVEMVRLGWSPFWTKYGKGRFAREFRRAEREAHEARRGLWERGAAADPKSAAPGRLGRAASCRPREDCCRICRDGAACGDSCIAASRTCRKEPGCACARDEVCGD